MNAKISVFVICVEAIIYLLLFNLHDCTFKVDATFKKMVLSQDAMDFLESEYLRCFESSVFPNYTMSKL